MSLLCKIGFHAPKIRETWLPSMSATIVREYYTETTCQRCGKTLGKYHLRWDGQDMKEVKT